MLAAPFLRSKSERFRDSLRVELVAPAGAEILYGLDEEPSRRYASAAEMSSSCSRRRQ